MPSKIPGTHSKCFTGKSLCSTRRNMIFRNGGYDFYFTTKGGGGGVS